MTILYTSGSDQQKLPGVPGLCPSVISSDRYNWHIKWLEERKTGDATMKASRKGLELIERQDLSERVRGIILKESSTDGTKYQ